LFPALDPLGRTYVVGQGRVLRVVGVVADIRRTLAPEGDVPAAYAWGGLATRRMIVTARLRTKDVAAAKEVTGAAASMGSLSGVHGEWLKERIDNMSAFRTPRFQAIVLGGFAFIALIVTALGVFGTVAFQVVSRGREMGVRLALGATPWRLVAMVIRQTLWPVLVGLGISGAALHWLAGLAETHLYRVDTRDPSTILFAPATVLVASLLAAVIPASRINRIRPSMVLRLD
jgi:ABC-type antimicrobial peptide transport system permease subunit